MAAPLPEGSRWPVVYSMPPSKVKHDGFLTLNYMPVGVVRSISLSSADGSKTLAMRFLNKNEAFPVSTAVEIKNYAVQMEAIVQDNVLCPPSTPLPPRSSIPIRTSSSLAPPQPTDRASVTNGCTSFVCEVGTEWNVTYVRISSKKSKKFLEGVLRLVQKNGRQRKVVLRDSEGNQIDEKFLRGSEEIACGKPLELDKFVVEVDDIKENSSSLSEIVVIEDSPINQMKLPRQNPKASLRGKATNRASQQDRAKLEIADIIEDSGTRRTRAPSKAFGQQEILPKRRDVFQVINSCTRPANVVSRDPSCTTNSCTRETAEFSSTSGRRHEDESSSTLDCVDRVQKLNVGRACADSYDDDCFYVEPELVQQENRLRNNRPDSVINLNDQRDFVVEQHEMSPEVVESEASIRTRRGFIKCSEEVKKVLDDRVFQVRDFWEGYKLYCFGHYSHCSRSKEQFLTSKMGRVVRLLHNEKDVRWGSKFDETVRQVWAMMEEYVNVAHGKDCTNLRALMEEFEDVKKLSTSVNGSLLLQLIKDDEHGTERLYRHSRNIQIQSTNIFDQFRSRLNQVDSSLDNLMKSSGTPSLSEKSSGILSDLDERELASRTFHENGIVGNTAKFSGDSRNKSKEWCKRALPSFDLGI